MVTKNHPACNFTLATIHLYSDFQLTFSKGPNEMKMLVFQKKQAAPVGASVP